MAFSVAIAVFSIFLLFQPTIAISDLLAPLLSPLYEITDNVCKEVECGKGTCKASKNATFFFECECDHGWKQSSDDHLLGFLPCIIPNCTINHSCIKAAASVPPKSQANESFFDPCHWADCGGGTCNKTSIFSYKCECAEGYNNLLDAAVLPCFKECAIGLDCSILGISVSNSSAASPPVADNDQKNQGSSIDCAIIHWTVLLIWLCFCQIRDGN